MIPLKAAHTKFEPLRKKDGSVSKLVSLCKITKAQKTAYKQVMDYVLSACNETRGYYPKVLDIKEFRLVKDSGKAEQFRHKVAQTVQRYNEKHAPTDPFYPRWKNFEYERCGFKMKQTRNDISERHKILRRIRQRYPNRLMGPGGRWLDSLPEEMKPIDNSPVTVQTVFHSSSTWETGLQILETGFALLATKDAGYFGAGIYFSHDLEYVTKQYGNEDDEGYKTVVMAQVVYGNPLPVLYKEGPPPYKPPFEPHKLVGKTLSGGFDVHTTVISQAHQCLIMPSESWATNKQTLYSELVAPADGMLLPLALLRVRWHAPR